MHDYRKSNNIGIYGFCVILLPIMALTPLYDTATYMAFHADRQQKSVLTIARVYHPKTPFGIFGKEKGPCTNA